MCPSCSYHFNYSSKQYINLILNENDRLDICNDIISNDPLNFTAIKNYNQQLEDAKNKTGINDAIIALSASSSTVAPMAP